ncbi:hypothetical protein MMC17_006959 [Xylographa soralifera]|nr:hypothetical protein [Xylographa soralifera]
MASPLHTILRRQSSSSSPPDTTPSLSQLISTLIPVGLVALIMTLAFLCLRRTQKRQYSPRTYLSTLRPQERTPPLPSGLFNWVGAFNKIPDSYVLNHQSIDGFLLLRFLKIASVICLVGCFITWPILFPVNATGGNQRIQLDILTYSNVDPGAGSNPRYYAHCFVAWAYLGFIWYMIMREMIYYINLRQAYLLSPLYANRLSSRTVLFASVPGDYLDEVKLRAMYGKKCKNLWIATDCKALQKLVDERDKVAFKLEGAETKLIKLANKARLKSLKKGAAHHEEASLDNNTDMNGESGSAAARWIQPKDRPTHRLKPIIGKKVDTINWCRAELERLIPLVDAEQAKHRAGDAKFVSSVFIEFYTQGEAQAAYQTTAHHLPLHMSPRFIGVNPDEVIWKNLRIKWWERILRNAATITFVVLLVIFWAIPVAVVGSISNINSLTDKVPFLSFILKIPTVILGVVQGLLPSVLLAVLMALLPIILRYMAKLGGMPSLARIELRTQNFYFIFQVIQVFLVTTLASAASTVVTKIINSPTSTPSLLAASLPAASNLYISYFLVQGLTIASGALLQIVGLILFKVLGKILDSTPRKMYKRFSSLSGLGWGTLFPIYTNLLVIAITYSTIAPLMLGFAAIGLWLLYFATRYNLLFVYNANIDTKGLVYPRALQQITVGIYLSIVCMIGLFGVSKAAGPAVLMAVFLVGSILFHVSLNSAIDPLLYTLPQSLEVEEQSLLALEDGNTNGYGKGEERVSNSDATLKNGNDTTHTASNDLPPAPHKQPNFITKWLFPNKFTDYQTLRRLVPKSFAEIDYTLEVERNAYYNPAVASPTPLLWIPRDEMGVSRQEISHTSKVIPISDELAFFDEKGNIKWDEDERPPIYQEKIYY